MKGLLMDISSFKESQELVGMRLPLFAKSFAGRKKSKTRFSKALKGLPM
jgi:hypothetical protein